MMAKKLSVGKQTVTPADILHPSDTLVAHSISKYSNPTPLHSKQSSVSLFDSHLLTASFSLSELVLVAEGEDVTTSCSLKHLSPGLHLHCSPTGSSSQLPDTSEGYPELTKSSLNNDPRPWCHLGFMQSSKREKKLMKTSLLSIL